MQLKHVRNIITEMGIDYSGVKISIRREPDLIGYDLFGWTSQDGKSVHLYPDAFRDREQLVKTIGHERKHVDQVRALGRVKNDEESSRREREAEDAEQYWWGRYQSRK